MGEKRSYTPRVAAILTAIEEGRMDDHIAAMQEAITKRNRKRQEAVQGLVQEVFGPNAVIQVSKSGPSAADNLFMKPKPTDVQPQEAEVQSKQRVQAPAGALEEIVPEDIDDPPPPAVLDADEGQSEIPIHLRGASIGGLSPSDMG